MVLHRRQLRQEFIIHQTLYVAFVIGEQQQRLAIQPRRQTLSRQLNNIFTCALAGAGVQAGRRLRQRETQLLQHFSL
ncbi:hypothetical protein GGER_37220 [Serratia rubidaea]